MDGADKSIALKETVGFLDLREAWLSVTFHLKHKKVALLLH